MVHQPASRFMTVSEAVDLMHVSEMIVYHLVHSDEMPAIRVEKGLRVLEATVGQLINLGLADHSDSRAAEIDS